MDITQAIREFLVPGQKNTNENLDRYPKEYLGLKVDLSFGLGMPSKVIWMGFFGDGHTVQICSTTIFAIHPNPTTKISADIFS